MREIKFRGKRSDNDKWVYGYYHFDDSGDGFDAHYISIKHDLDVIEVKPETVGQYTGLKDKNGVDIFEGDLCLGHREGEDVIYEILWLPHCVKFGAKVIQTKYVLSKNLSFPLQHYIKDGSLECVFEVIGSIYTHPHLLGSEKE